MLQAAGGASTRPARLHAGAVLARGPQLSEDRGGESSMAVGMRARVVHARSRRRAVAFMCAECARALRQSIARVAHVLVLYRASDHVQSWSAPPPLACTDRGLYACRCLPPSCRVAQRGKRGQLARLEPSSAANLAAGAGSPAIVVRGCTCAFGLSLAILVARYFIDSVRTRVRCCALSTACTIQTWTRKPKHVLLDVGNCIGHSSTIPRH